jgi:P27 family predicted phage terminase small subunit
VPRLTPATERLKRGDHRIAALAARREPIPETPDGLDAALWSRVFTEAPHLTSRDTRLVAMLCRLLDDAAQLRGVIESEGRFTLGARGSRASHPAVRQLRDAEQAILAVSSQLVLTPLARSRAAVPDATPTTNLVDHFRDRMTAQTLTGTPEVPALIGARPRATRPATDGAPTSERIPPSTINGNQSTQEK